MYILGILVTSNPQCTFATSIVKNPRGRLKGLSIINDPQIVHSKSNNTTPIRVHHSTPKKVICTRHISAISVEMSKKHMDPIE